MDIDIGSFLENSRWYQCRLFLINRAESKNGKKRIKELDGSLNRMKATDKRTVKKYFKKKKHECSIYKEIACSKKKKELT